MVLDGVLGDPKGRANLLVRRPCRQQLQDLQLPGAQLLFRTGLLTVGPGDTGELVENLGGRRPGDWGLPLEDPAENPQEGLWFDLLDRKSTRLNSSHDQISYAVFCLKKKKK